MSPPSSTLASPEYSLRPWIVATAARVVADDAGAAVVPAAITGNEVLREESLRYTVQLLVAERCSLAAAAGLIGATPHEAWKRFLASQAADEALHVELFNERLYALGTPRDGLETAVARHAHPDLLGLSAVVLAPVHEGDFLAGLVAQGLILGEILSATYELLRAWSAPLDPRFAAALGGLVADEARHAAFAEAAAAQLLDRRPDRKTSLARIQRDMTRLMLVTFAAAFRDNPMPEELRRVLGGDAAREPASWAGIDPLASEPLHTQAALERVVTSRIRDRFVRLGIAYRRPLA